MMDNEIVETPNPALRKALVVGVGGFLIVFLAAFALGYTHGAMEHEALPPFDYFIIAGLWALVLLTAFGCWKFWPRGEVELLSSSAKKSRMLYVIGALIGIILGFFIALSGGPDEETLFSNGPIGSVTAIVAIIVWAIVTPIITLFWWRTADEHEIASYSDGAVFAFHIYLFLAPSWWMATRAGWLPQQDPMIVWTIAISCCSVVWLYRKYS